MSNLSAKFGGANGLLYVYIGGMSDLQQSVKFSLQGCSEYLETRIEHLEDKLSSKHAELIADEIKLSNKSDEIKTLKAENERLAAELTKQTAYNEILMKLYFEL